MTFKVTVIFYLLLTNNNFVVSFSYHHENKSDGHENVCECHHTLVGCNGHGHCSGSVGHQSDCQGEDQKGPECGFEPWEDKKTFTNYTDHIIYWTLLYKLYYRVLPIMKYTMQLKMTEVMVRMVMSAKIIDRK